MSSLMLSWMQFELHSLNGFQYQGTRRKSAIATDRLLPPYTLEEQRQEMVMRTRAFHWRIQRLQAKQQHLQACGASEPLGPGPALTTSWE